MSVDTKSALSKQIGGSHYKGYEIEPKVFFIKNQIPGHKTCIIERILRYDHPTGKGLEDLEKIKHEVDLIIEIEGWGKTGAGIPTAKKERMASMKNKRKQPGRRVTTRDRRDHGYSSYIKVRLPDRRVANRRQGPRRGKHGQA